MTLPTIFANLPTGNSPAALLDTNFNAVAAMGITQCTATGTNTIALTQNSNQPTVSSYVNYLQFGFVAVATTTGSVTINVNSIGAVPAYLYDGTTQASTGNLVSGVYYEVVYNSALNSGAGGFQLLNTSPVGSFISSNVAGGSAVSLTSGMAANVTSISLPPGRWLIWGNIGLNIGSSTVFQVFEGWINTVSASAPTPPGAGAFFALQLNYPTGAVSQLFTIGTTRLSLSTTTTVYLSTVCTFNTSTAAAYGFIGAQQLP